MRKLLATANRLGVLVFACKLPGDMLGCYVPDQQRIYLDTRLTPAEQRTVLAHEIGHAYYGHGCTDGNATDAAHERRADVYAARLLIDPAEYERLELIHPDPHLIADELGVTVGLVEIYRAHCLTALHGVTYADARDGSGQWAHRALRDAGEDVA